MPEPTTRRGEADIKELLDQTIRLYRQEGRRPGPWKDCARLVEAAGGGDEECEDLYPDFADIYCEVIAGTCSFRDKIFTQSEEWLLKRKKWLSKPFFELCPKYAQLEQFVSETVTPELYRELRTYETLRLQLLEVIDWVLADRSP